MTHAVTAAMWPAQLPLSASAAPSFKSEILPLHDLTLSKRIVQHHQLNLSKMGCAQRLFHSDPRCINDSDTVNHLNLDIALSARQLNELERRGGSLALVPDLSTSR